MATPITMPTLGLTMEAGTITRWLKQEGDAVAKDEPLFVVETDKAENEVESPVGGVLLKILAAEGQEVPVQRVIAYVGQPGEQVADGSQTPAPPAATAEAPAAASAQPSPAPQAESTAPAATAERRELRASPLARKVARELGIDLQQVRGSGPEGRIQDADVRAFAEARAAAPAATAPVESAGAAPRVTAHPPAAAGELEQLNRVRRVTAERMAQSARSVARVTLFAEADFAEAVRFRSHLKEEFEARFGAKLTFDAMLVKASASALREIPVLNAQWADGAIRHVPDVNIGVAIAVEQGLLVAVVRNADRKSLAEICKDVEGMAAQARQGKLQAADMTGSTFTITNLGGHGVDAFTPIVNPPEAAILGVGRIAQRPFVVDGRVEPRHTAWLSLAFDHRVTDGAPAGDFLTRIRQIVEKPYLLVGI